MKRFSSISATSSTTNRHHHHHHHHHHSHSFSYSKNKERLLPLHRSITDDDKYQNSNASPITRFVRKLLGM
jgi:hypothetical protein